MANLTPLKAIRAKCLDCSCGQRQEVRCCPIKSCPLYEYRMGKRPATVEKHEQKKSRRFKNETD